jgi:NAD-specific glutamate dehydrogenase
MLGKRQRAIGALGAIAIAVATTTLVSRAAAVEPTVDELKARVTSASVGDRPRLCVQIAQKQLAETSRLYAATEDEKAQPALADVVMYSELARDYALESHKHQKQTEIAVREMTRKLEEILHTLGHEEQVPVQDAVKHLERVRDDLLMAMFPKGAQ